MTNVWLVSNRENVDELIVNPLSHRFVIIVIDVYIDKQFGTKEKKNYTHNNVVDIRFVLYLYSINPIFHIKLS